MTTLILASNNQHKIREIRTILRDLPIEFVTLADVVDAPPLIEDGETFEENALKKARTVFRHSNICTLADDSGLEVFYLNMRPGIFSARYAGVGATDEENNRKLLHEMRGVAPRRRHAQFRSVLALVGKGFEDVTVGLSPGVLAEEPRGTNGFGYDPLFIPEGKHVTYAELPDDEKNLISHRARSLAAMREILTRRFG
jgi:XTP/dITP diphosphohydrolase